MTSPNTRPPASSAPYAPSERLDSTGRNLSVSFDPESQRHGSSSNYGNDGQQDMARRRSSFADRLHAIGNAGGPNSIASFSRSFQRSVGFHQITPIRQAFKYEDSDEESEPEFTRSELDTSPMAQRSLLREQLASSEDSAEGPHADVFDETPDASRVTSQDQGTDERSPLIRQRPSRARVRGDSIFQIEPQLGSSLGGTYGSTWGSLSSRVNEPSMRHAGRLFQQQQLEGVTEPDKELEPLLVKQIQEADGTIVNVVVGQSTLPQTVFNSINTLVGVGILAVPLAMSICGWWWGLGFLFFSGVATNYTAKMLAKCLDKDSSLVNYGDIAYAAGGRWLQFFVSIIFLIELTGACVALVILFSDAMGALGVIEWITGDFWKLGFGVILIPMVFMPLKYLSFTSIVGIICCFLIMACVVFDGTQRAQAPGSLHELMPTTAGLPEMTDKWSLFFAWGILMAPWGGHSVFPNIYRDMRHPYHFRWAVDLTYLFTFSIVAAMAVIGYIMFGDTVLNEITKNLAVLDGYPRWVIYAVTVMLAVMPITKAPLNAHPIVGTMEKILGLDHRSIAGHGPMIGLKGFWRGIAIICNRLICIAVFVGIAAMVPAFDKVMSLIGSLACFTICIIFPCWFHLSLYGDSMHWWHKVFDWALMLLSIGLMGVCTVSNFMAVG